MRYFLRTTLAWVGVAFIGDTMLGPLMTFGGIGPDFSVIAVVVLGLAAGAAPATVGGFMLGLVQDLANPSLLGLQALCKCVLGYGVGAIRRRLVYGVPLVEGVVVTVAVFAHDLVYLLVQSNLADEQFLMPLLTRSLPGAVYTGLIGIPVIRLCELMGVLRQED